MKLWHLFIAAQFVDFLWGACVLAGIEHVRIVRGFTASNDLDLWHMPYTHGLFSTVGWALVTFVVWRLARKEPTRTGDAAVFALVVASHFLLDFVVHAGDLPLLAAQGPKLGLGLWQHKTLALLVETSIFAVAAWFWWRPRSNAAGARAAGGALLALTALAAVSFYVPTPPSASAMALTGLGTWVGCTALAWWIERKAS